MFSGESTIRDVLKSPLGSDLIEILRNELKVHKALIYNRLTGSLKLKNLARLSGGYLKRDFIDMLIGKLNQYTDETLPSHGKAISPRWWKEAVAYQVYPRSFRDKNGDGIGDLGGVIDKLDYLKELGIDLIWLSPVYDSPNDDNGYDIRDYRKIMADFGTMEDFDALLEGCHKRGMRLIMDLVINHTSDEHEWFQNALKGQDNPYREYYIWKESSDGNPPNNWTSFFSGPAWNYDEASAQWNLHIWSRKQIDLNWNHEPMRRDLYSMVNWWLEKGIDGFRLDVINFISKADGLPDGDPTVAGMNGITGVEHYAFGPRVHQHLRELNRETFSKYGALTVGETPGLGLKSSQLFTHEERRELDMVFSFDHLDSPGADRFDGCPFDLNYLKEQMLYWQQDYGNSCWNTLFLENHDYPRMISKINSDPLLREPLAKLLAALLLTLKGTPFIYQGQEIAMANAEYDSIEEFRDVESLNLYRKLVDEGMSPEKALARIVNGSRDHSRTPVQWSAGDNAGFSDAQPWISPGRDCQRYNVEDQMADSQSVYHFYKRMIALRKEYSCLVYGDFIPFRSGRKDVFSYFRRNSGASLYVEMNLSASRKKRNRPLKGERILAANYSERDSAVLAPYEAVVLELHKHSE